MRTETFLFDLGNVLQFFSLERWHAQLAALAHTSSEAIGGARAESGVFEAFERGELDEDGVRAWFESTFDVSISAEQFHQAYSDIFWANDSMVPVLDALRARGHRLVLLSNTNTAHLRWIRGRSDVLDRFDHLVLSHEVGAMKPDDRIFAEALRHIDCAPAECLYTDDIERYVIAAHRHGLDAVVFTTTAAFVADLAARAIVLEQPGSTLAECADPAPLPPSG